MTVSNEVKYDVVEFLERELEFERAKVGLMLSRVSVLLDGECAPSAQAIRLAMLPTIEDIEAAMLPPGEL